MIHPWRRGWLLLAGVLGIALASCSREEVLPDRAPVMPSSAEPAGKAAKTEPLPPAEAEERSSTASAPEIPSLADGTTSKEDVDAGFIPDDRELKEKEPEDAREYLRLSTIEDELEMKNGTLYILSFNGEDSGRKDGAPLPDEIRTDTVAVLPKEEKQPGPESDGEKIEPPLADTKPELEEEPAIIEPEPGEMESVDESEPVIAELDEEEPPIALVLPEVKEEPDSEDLPDEGFPVEEPETPPAVTEGPQIILASPLAGDYYRSTLLLDGRCLPLEDGKDEKEGRVKSLSWRIPSQGEWSNPVFMEEDGSFQLDLMTAGLEGGQQLILESEDFGGRISRLTIGLRDGNQPPKIVLESGTDERSYGALLALKGTLEDPYAGIAGLEGYRGLGYRLVPRDRNSENVTLEGDIHLEKDGSFFMAIDMEGREGEQILLLEAEGINASVRTLELSLVPGRGDIPSFAMTPQDGRLVFDWEEVPGMREQNLYLTDDPGLEPAEDPKLNFPDVKPPLVIDRTDNGRRYRAQLEILTEEGRFRSELMEAVPLAPGTLDLRAEGGFEQVTLDWKTIPGARLFRIWRKSENEEDYSVLADGLEGSSYIDATATFGTSYRYRIEPSDIPGPLSYAVPAASIESPSDKMTLASHYRQVVPEKIAVRGDYAFIAAGEGGFHIMDISIPQTPESIGFLEQEGVHDVYLGSEYVYLASGNKGFQIVNIEEPKRPFTVLSRVTPDARCIAGREELVFVGDAQLGLQVFDIRDRQSPQRLSSLREYRPEQIVLEGDRLYAALGEGGLVTLDISNPYGPREIGTFSDTPVYDVLLQDGLMYLACGEDGMVILAADGSGLWREISRFEGSDTRMVRLWESYAMIADGSGGMKAVDVSDPRSPRYYGLFSSRDIRALAMADDYALLADVSGLKVVRTYLYGQSFVRQRWETPGRAYGVLAAGRQLWVADRTGGVAVYQSDSPASMSDKDLLRTFPSEFAEDFLIRDQILYVADGPAGVKAFRLDRAGNEPVLDVSVSGRARRVLPYASRFAVVTSGEGVLFFKERATGESLNWEIASRFYSSDPRDALFFGELLVVGDARDGLIMAREFEGQFREMQRFGEYRGIRQLASVGDTLYVLHSEGVALLDMTNPDHPIQTAFIPAADAEAFQIQGDRLYLAEGFRGISVYRLSRSEQPYKVSVCDEVFAVDAAPSGDFAYVADMDGIAVVKIIVPDWK